MVIGRRTNVPWKNNQSVYLSEDVMRVATEGRLFAVNAEDFFFVARNQFPWHLVKDDLVIARPGYDNYIVAIAVRHNVSVVDATETVLAVHQTDRDGNMAGFNHADHSQNHRLIGAFNYLRGLTTSAQYKTKLSDSGNDKVVGVYRRKSGEKIN